MTSVSTQSAQLSEAHAAFVCGPQSIVAASRNAEQRPSMARGLGCIVSADRRTVRILFHPEQATELLEDVRSQGVIAVVFSEPPTHITLQIKGSDARVVETPPGAEQLRDEHIGQFAQTVMPLGFAPALIIGAIRGTPVMPCTVEFTLDSVFEQTPGAKAGVRLP